MTNNLRKFTLHKMKPLSEYCVDRNNNFNLLRLVGASLVIFGHSYATYGPQGTRDFIDAHIPSINAGHLGVQIFFVISGFLVTQSFVNKRHVIEFLASRVLRIFPGLLVALLFTVLLGAFMTKLSFAEYVSNHKVWEYFSSNGVLSIRWELPGVFENNSLPNVVNGSLWTLPKEFSLYLILMVFGVAGGLTSRAITNLSCAGAVFVHLQKTATYYLTGGDNNVDSVLFCFLIGVLFYANRRQIFISFRIAAGVFFLTLLSVRYDYYTFVTVQICIAYLVFVLAYHERLQFPIFRHADYSYGLYIYAFPIQQTLAGLNVTKNFSFYILLCFAVTLPFAIFSWYVIERPSLRLKSAIRKFFPLSTIATKRC
ncbi:MAG: acyltransferase [Pseudomonadota bacterium]